MPQFCRATTSRSADCQCPSCARYAPSASGKFARGRAARRRAPLAQRACRNTLQGTHLLAAPCRAGFACRAWPSIDQIGHLSRREEAQVHRRLSHRTMLKIYDRNRVSTHEDIFGVEVSVRQTGMPDFYFVGERRVSFMSISILSSHARSRVGRTRANLPSSRVGFRVLSLIKLTSTLICECVVWRSIGDPAHRLYPVCFVIVNPFFEKLPGDFLPQCASAVGSSNLGRAMVRLLCGWLNPVRQSAFNNSLICTLSSS